MQNNATLHETINTAKDAVKRFQPDLLAIPAYITDNLKHQLFDWQREALENLLYYETPKAGLKKSPTHLMFNLATGAGKTLLIAAAILHYYKQGYRHFLFFVSLKNIVDKTENNFVVDTHAKYLFTRKIVIDEQSVSINKVENFSANPCGIEIKFTTTGKFHNDIHTERENQTTLADLHRKDIVLLADEAHNLNADTKKIAPQKEIFSQQLTGRTGAAEFERRGWEHTVLELVLHKNNCARGGADNRNVLLEFTATIPENAQVEKKYADKIIHQFPLKDFMRAGYTKEINLVSSTLAKKERVLHALLFHWYRHRIALQNDIPNFKPVILFRSKEIKDSEAEYEEFLHWMENLSGADFAFLDDLLQPAVLQSGNSANEMGQTRTKQILEFIRQHKTTKTQIAAWLRENFTAKTTRITNSKPSKKAEEQETERLLNNLEDIHNPVRAIFTVKRLTEGWDVLNLFDIVRLYQGQNSGGSNTKTPKATTEEKQLIGRGVRYFPFTAAQNPDAAHNQRKFDADVQQDLRVLEELNYYTYDEESRYISHLKTELQKDGYLDSGYQLVMFDLKPAFKKQNFYKHAQIWQNRPQTNPNRKKNTLKGIKSGPGFTTPFQISRLKIREEGLDENAESPQPIPTEQGTKTLRCDDIDSHIFRKAIHIKAKQSGSLYRFENLRTEIQITSIAQLQEELADFRVQVALPQGTEISHEHKLQIALKILDSVQAQLKQCSIPKIGGKFTSAKLATVFAEAKTKRVKLPENDADYAPSDSHNADWYVLDASFEKDGKPKRFAGGSQEEKDLVEFIKNHFANLKGKYEDIYLLRNEEVYKIYDFQQARGFQPDFLLFLRGNDNLYYQVFIEAKGDQFKDENGTFAQSREAWKQEFLDDIKNRYGLKKPIHAENKSYRLYALPFYNTADADTIFKPKFNELLKK